MQRRLIRQRHRLQVVRTLVVKSTEGGSASPCLNLDGLSSSDDDIGTSVGLDDLSVTLLCGSELCGFPRLIPIRSSRTWTFPWSQCHMIGDRLSVDVLLVDAPPVRRPGGPRRSVTRVPLGKRMPGEVSMTISPVPPSMDVTFTCASGVVPMPTQPAAVTTVPAMSMATVAMSMFVRDR